MREEEGESAQQAWQQSKLPVMKKTLSAHKAHMQPISCFGASSCFLGLGFHPPQYEGGGDCILLYFAPYW